jgi:CheY-like chemotaxis protein
MSPKYVLYAEDDENDSFFFRRGFKRVGISDPLVTVPNGQEAIDYCSGGGRFGNRVEYPRPSLILLDLNMPKKSGIEVLRWIRHEPKLRTLPVIIFTSSLQDEDIHRAYLEGANAYLVKPSDPDELVVLVKTLCDFWLYQNRTSRKDYGALPGE